LNVGKTEKMIIGTRQKLKKFLKWNEY
jgi:hypothetical protein